MAAAKAYCASKGIRVKKAGPSGSRRQGTALRTDYTVMIAHAATRSKGKPKPGQVRVCQLPIDQIKPSPENTKLYGPVDPQDPAIIAMARSIPRNGVMSELHVTQDFYIEDGHRRHVAAQLAGMETVPCVITPHVRERDIDGHVSRLREGNRQRVKGNDVYPRVDGYLFNALSFHTMHPTGDASIVLLDDPDPVQLFTTRIGHRVTDVSLAECISMASLTASVRCDGRDPIYREPHDLFDEALGPSKSMSTGKNGGWAPVLIHQIQRDLPFLLYTKYRMDGLGLLGQSLLCFRRRSRLWFAGSIAWSRASAGPDCRSPSGRVRSSGARTSWILAFALYA